MDGKNYSAVPPPPSLSSSSKGSSLDFNDALSKARAIAEKLKQQTPSTTDSSALGSSSSYSSGTKRSYNDDDREEYQGNSGSRSYGSYQDDRESKRGAYDSGSSRPSYGGGNDYRRSGLGSDDRKPYGQSFGGNTEEYSVPNHMVGLLIGKGGENLKKIERMSGVSKVQFSNDTSGSERQVHLTGEPDQIKIAKDMIRQMVDDARNNDGNRFGGGRSNDYGASQHGGNSITVKIPVGKVGLVIGRGGETIRDFEERSKAKILIASDGSGDINNERSIKVVGDDAAVELAKSLIEDIVYGNNNGAPGRNYGQQYQHQPYGNGNSDYQQQHPSYAPNSSYGVNRMGRPDDERIFVTVPASSVGLIIGRGGETVRSLQEQSGARVKIDPTTDPNSEERTVNISGDPKCVAIAKQLVEEKVAEANRGSGRYGGYNNDGYGGRGGYRSHNQQGYQGGEGGYDYSQQYGQYYAQYGYDQSQYGGQDASAYQQYPGYQYNAAAYGGYNDQIPGAEQNSDSSAPPPPSSSNADRKGSDASNKGEDQNSNAANATTDPSAYYAQYYGGQQATPEQQQAYYQWYQQYYGAQQQQQYGQQQDSAEQNEKEPSTGEKENVDGEPIDDNQEKSTEPKEVSKD